MKKRTNYPNATYYPETGLLGTEGPVGAGAKGLPLPAAVLLGPLLGGIMFMTLPIVTIVATAWLVVQRLSGTARPRHPALKPTS